MGTCSQAAVFHVGQNTRDARAKVAGFFAVTPSMVPVIHGISVLNSGLCVDFLELQRQHENVVDLISIFNGFIVAVIGAGGQQGAGIGVEITQRRVMVRSELAEGANASPAASRAASVSVPTRSVNGNTGYSATFASCVPPRTSGSSTMPSSDGRNLLRPNHTLQR